ncbi:Endoplasmic reticulum aminopeptidase 1 [Armadillidium vulgare]|nr:Endoplasmic reticulum aminopeptidase 1 [Armadillidium vulgare]
MLLYNPKVDKAENKMLVATIIAHELAHQWFGNLVTPAWWNDLWLSEGFATYMSYLLLNNTEPNLKPFQLFGEKVLHVAFDADSFEWSHPVSVEVSYPHEIQKNF